MSKAVLVIGNSGTGKSTSMRTLKPEETVVIRITAKDLPFKGASKLYKAWTKENPEGNLLDTSSSEVVVNALKSISDKRPNIKNVIIDDIQYLMSFEYMQRAKESGYAKFTDIAINFYNILSTGMKLRDDLFVVYLAHGEDVNTPDGIKTKIKTVGKLIDEKITPEGLFTVVLMTKVEKDETGIKHYFVTQSDGTNPAKSPSEMFDTLLIPNDLALVKEAMYNY